MALPLLTYTDFTGALKLSVGFTEQEDVLNEYIAREYPILMREILGNEAKETIEGFDWVTEPLVIPQKWQDLIFGVSYDNIKRDRNVRYYGFQEIALPILYFLYNRDLALLSNTGFVRNENENSFNSAQPFINSVVSRVYNEGIRLNNESLIPFINNYTDYQSVISSIVDNTGTLTINTSDTIYLADGDTVTINDSDYVISNLVDNTSFDITSSLIDADTFTYSPFDIVNVTRKLTTF